MREADTSRVTRSRLLITSLIVIGSLTVPAGVNAAGIHAAKQVSGADRARQAVVDDADAGPLIAPPSACPGQTSLGTPADAQEQAMLCMVNYARAGYGLGTLAENASLDGSAALKSRDIIDCDEFSHFACGREFTHWMAQTGYLSQNCWRVGENIAWGRGRFGTARSIFLAWMRSDTHRENLLGDYAETGLDLTTGNLEGGPTRVWTQHFGLIRCESA